MMKKLILLTEVGYLSSRPRLASPPKIVGRLDSEALDDEAFLQGSGLSTQAQGNVDAKDSFDYSEAPLSNQTTNTLDKNINMFSSGVMGNEISEMLEEWEEPELQDLDVDVSILPDSCAFIATQLTEWWQRFS